MLRFWIPVSDGDLTNEVTVANLRWREEDQVTFDLDSELVGEKVFKPDKAPFRLYDMSHESKNLNGKVKDLVEKNGFKTLLGPRNRLHLTLFIQMTMKQFYKEQSNPTPLKWIEHVDLILAHCRGNHSECDKLNRFGQKKSVFDHFWPCSPFLTVFDHFWPFLFIFDRNKAANNRRIQEIRFLKIWSKMTGFQIRSIEEKQKKWRQVISHSWINFPNDSVVF